MKPGLSSTGFPAATARPTDPWLVYHFTDYDLVMRILLPPSEGKTPGDGQPIQLDQLSFPKLNPTRRLVAQALIAASRSPEAGKILKLGPKSIKEVQSNQYLWEQPTGYAGEIYTGVLYEAAATPELFQWLKTEVLDQEGKDTGLNSKTDLDKMGEGSQLDNPWQAIDAALAKRISDRLKNQVCVISALWGIITLGDRIPAYRLSIGTDLPDLGKLGNYWRPHLLTELENEDLILNCCSGAYTQAWQPPAKHSLQSAIIHTQVLKAGKVVSHWAKHTRGLILRYLLRSLENWENWQNVPQLVELLDHLFAEAGTGRVIIDQNRNGSWQLIVMLTEE